jgi:hypothetical protein
VDRSYVPSVDKKWILCKKSGFKLTNDSKVDLGIKVLDELDNELLGASVFCKKNKFSLTEAKEGCDNAKRLTLPWISVGVL